jgi:hypothetical protein
VRERARLMAEPGSMMQKAILAFRIVGEQEARLLLA